jgi:hypothetical protein
MNAVARYLGTLVQRVRRFFRLSQNVLAGLGKRHPGRECELVVRDLAKLGAPGSGEAEDLVPRPDYKQVVASCVNGIYARVTRSDQVGDGGRECAVEQPAESSGPQRIPGEGAELLPDVIRVNS